MSRAIGFESDFEMSPDNRKRSIDELGLSGFDPSAPLRLQTVAKIAFPDGSMSASGLRREAARGRLVIERIAGKDFTTLANIRKMRELCRVEAKGQGFTCVAPAPTSGGKRSGSSAMDGAISPRDALQARLTKDRRKQHSKL
jgi:hypothetical protein